MDGVKYALIYRMLCINNLVGMRCTMTEDERTPQVGDELHTVRRGSEPQDYIINSVIRIGDDTVVVADNDEYTVSLLEKDIIFIIDAYYEVFDAEHDCPVPDITYKGKHK